MKNESEFFTGIQYFIERKMCFKGFDDKNEAIFATDVFFVPPSLTRFFDEF
jgi:hypothetical protein